MITSRASPRESHSLRNGSVSSTLRAPTNEGSTAMRVAIAADRRACASAGIASRAASTVARSACFASRSAAAGRASIAWAMRGMVPQRAYNHAFAAANARSARGPPRQSRAPMNHAHHVYRDRRAAILARMREHAGGGLAVVPTAPEVIRNRDSHYPYRSDSYFHYLTGFPEPEAVVALVASPDGDKHLLFCRERNEEREIWDGFRYGPDAAKEIFGFDEAHPIAELDAKLADLCADRPALFTPVGLSEPWDRKVSATLNEVRARVRTGVAAPEQIVDIRALLDSMRLVKDAHELALMRRAAAISSAAHKRAMAKARPGWHEYQVEAELMHEFLHGGAQAVAYGSIVASGPNACVLHYRDNNRLMGEGELLLIDAGCEYQGYASDITRTFPVNGSLHARRRRRSTALVLRGAASPASDACQGRRALGRTITHKTCRARG